ncbi:transposase [Streptomyces katrae]|uniref:Transposase n=1 Tax=Streptomyces katrae TaxID=68223 RepID=A0ABT7GQC5_9ACTN|nr:transposase [Streptomyces katrae]MDK9495804.1 transposase [Streptomyces katrae]
MGRRKGKRGKSVHDQSLGMFARTLEAKCARYGRTFAKVCRWFPSTQLCSACGSIEGPKGLEGLKIRHWVCSCGAAHDRDENAELNLRREGRRIVAEGRPDT